MSESIFRKYSFVCFLVIAISAVWFFSANRFASIVQPALYAGGFLNNTMKDPDTNFYYCENTNKLLIFTSDRADVIHVRKKDLSKNSQRM